MEDRVELVIVACRLARQGISDLERHYLIQKGWESYQNSSLVRVDKGSFY